MDFIARCRVVPVLGGLVLIYRLWNGFWRRRGDATRLKGDGGVVKGALEDDLLAFSSQAIAAARAVETMRGDNALIVDKYAETLAGRVAMERAKTRGTSPRIAIRTKFFDDWLLQTTREDGDVTQVVLPAVGMDTRVYRLPLRSDLHLFEIDQDIVIDEKEKLLATVKPPPQPRCQLSRIAADLSNPFWKEKLISRGFRPEDASVWLLEGLLYYLEEHQVQQLFRAILALTSKNSKSLILCSLVSTLQLQSEAARDLSMTDGSGTGTIFNFSKAFKWSCADPTAFFASLGFQVVDITPIGSKRASYGRWQGPESGKTFYVTMKPSQP